MGKPIEHAKSSAKTFGGVPVDYLDIYEFLDSSKGAFSDLRHRALTHNAWFITTILKRIFGEVRVNSDGDEISVRAVGEQHVLEDFKGKFIPSAQDYLAEIEFKDWMNNGEGEPPPSRAKAQGLVERLKKKKKKIKALSEVKEQRSILEGLFDGEGGYINSPYEPKRSCGGAGMID